MSAELTTAWMLGCVCGFFVGVTVAASRRRLLRLRRSPPPCGGGEITLAEWEAMRTPFAEGRTICGNGNGGPTTPKPGITPKPQPAGGHLIIEGRLFGGYQPRPQQGTPNPPPSEP